MARYKMILAYDGTDFQGSQRQADHRTVQGELEKSLRKLGWNGRSVLLAGRTDAGVHASGQVAAFDLEWKHADGQLLKALNAELPLDAAVTSLGRAAADFHPRFDARSRCYRYRLFFAPIRDPLRERYAWRLWPAVEDKLLKRSADLFPGTHDFAAFGSPTTPKGTTVRTVKKAGWKKMPGGGWQFEVQADAFLYRMVRRMVFVQVSLAQGRCTREEVRSALKRQSGLPAGLAPAHGLELAGVGYGSH